MVVEGFLAARQSSLESAVRELKMKDAPAGTRDWRRQAWDDLATIPRISELNESIRGRAMGLADPEPVNATYAVNMEEPSSRWQVTSEHNSKIKYTVDLRALALEQYDKCCSCGMTSSSWVCVCL